MTIPKIIHQTWKTTQIPNTMKNYAQSWKTLNPGYDYILWTDDDIRRLISNNYPWFLDYYDSYPHHIMRVDAFRFFVLHHYGGVYADLDMECYKPIDDLLTESKLLLFLEWPQSISNAIIASEPRHPFLEHCFKLLMEKHIKNGVITDVWETTGPKFLTEAMQSYKDDKDGQDYKLYPSYFFFPIPWHYPKRDQSGLSHVYPNSFGAHHWQGTWWQPQPIDMKIIFISVSLLMLVICINKNKI